MPVSREDVINAYRFILGREPENEKVITQQQSAAADIAALRAQFLNSAEFLAKLPEQGSSTPATVTLTNLALPPQTVESTASAEQMTALLAHVGQTWSALGNSEPYWSVLTDNRFRRQYIDGVSSSLLSYLFRKKQPKIAEFYNTGHQEIGIIKAFLARCAPDFDPKSATCIEYGCGVGRVTWLLASLFQHVLACDISPAHLAKVKNIIEANSLNNVEPFQISADHLSPVIDVDFWFSHIVLQHNPPPLIAQILETAFRSLRPGGITLFQVTTYCKGYEFNVEKYLRTVLPNGASPASQNVQMEMHVLPQSTIFALAEVNNMSVLEVREDNSTGDMERYVSNFFVMRKKN
jgi:SAM-dependent methyltransferase